MSDDSVKARVPNIRDVARVAGVSHQTVSRVLNSHPSIRDATRQRVLDVIDELHYRPNLAARALVTSHSRRIGILAASSGSFYGPASSIHAIEDAARDEGYTVTTSNLAAADPASIEGALRQLVSENVEGIVIIAPQVRVFDVIGELSIEIPFVTMQATGRLADHSLWVDQIAGARLATRHLIDLGHESILHVAGPQDWIEAEARMRGFVDEILAQDLPMLAPILGDWTADFGYRAGRELSKMRDFTAVFASNDQMALGLLHAFREVGLDVPGDVSVVGFDDIPEARHFWPPLTSVRQDFAELGRRCIRLLLSDLEGERIPYLGTIAPELVVRQSTAPRR